MLFNRLGMRFFVSLVFLCLFILFRIPAYAQLSVDDIYDWKYYQISKDTIQSHYYDLSYTQPLDIDQYCPNYKELDREKRIMFWIAFLKELSTVESSNKPNTIYQEKFTDNEGFYVYSIGLFQLSLESSKGNYKCDVNTYEELQNPTKNIQCTIRIFDKLIQEDNYIRDYRLIAQKQEWRGLSRYWGSIRNRKKINKIKYELSNLSICTQDMGFAFRR
jgi:hypothetical protein